MRKIMLLAMVIGLLGVATGLVAQTKHAGSSGNLPGSSQTVEPKGRNWIKFTTVYGSKIGEPDVINVYYHADTLRINKFEDGQALISVSIADNAPGTHVGYYYIAYSDDGWKYSSVDVPGRFTEVPHYSIGKGSVLHELLLTLAKKGLLTGIGEKHVRALTESELRDQRMHRPADKKELEQLWKEKLARDEEKKIAEEKKITEEKKKAETTSPSEFRELEKNTLMEKPR